MQHPTSTAVGTATREAARVRPCRAGAMHDRTSMMRPCADRDMPRGPSASPSSREGPARRLATTRSMQQSMQMSLSAMCRCSDPTSLDETEWIAASSPSQPSRESTQGTGCEQGTRETTQDVRVVPACHVHRPSSAYVCGWRAGFSLGTDVENSRPLEGRRKKDEASSALRSCSHFRRYAARQRSRPAVDSEDGPGFQQWV